MFKSTLQAVLVIAFSSVATQAAAQSYWSWGESASANAFEHSLENPDDGILLDNWPVTHWTVHIQDADTFEGLVQNRYHLRNVVARRVLEICLEQERSPKACHAARSSLRRAWVEEDSSGFVGGYRLATTFISVDQDNWFGFEQISQKTLDYLSVGRRELRLYKGFRSTGVLDDGGLTLRDLPVVIDHDEQTITLWNANLFD